MGPDQIFSKIFSRLPSVNNGDPAWESRSVSKVNRSRLASSHLEAERICTLRYQMHVLKEATPCLARNSLDDSAVELEKALFVTVSEENVLKRVPWGLCRFKIDSVRLEQRERHMAV